MNQDQFNKVQNFYPAGTWKYFDEIAIQAASGNILQMLGIKADAGPHVELYVYLKSLREAYHTKLRLAERLDSMQLNMQQKLIPLYSKKYVLPNLSGCGDSPELRDQLHVLYNARNWTAIRKCVLEDPDQYVSFLRTLHSFYAETNAGHTSLTLPFSALRNEAHVGLLKKTAEKLRNGVSTDEIIDQKFTQIVDGLPCEIADKVRAFCKCKRDEYETQVVQIAQLEESLANQTTENPDKKQLKLLQSAKKMVNQATRTLGGLGHRKLRDSGKLRPFKDRAKVMEDVLRTQFADPVLSQLLGKYCETELNNLRSHFLSRIDTLRKIWPTTDVPYSEQYIWSNISRSRDFIEAVAFFALDLTTVLKEYGDIVENDRLCNIVCSRLMTESASGRQDVSLSPVLLESEIFAALPIRNFLAHGDIIVQTMIPDLNSVGVLNISYGFLKNSCAITALLDLFTRQDLMRYLRVILSDGTLDILTPDNLPTELRDVENMQLIAALQSTKGWSDLLQQVLQDVNESVILCNAVRTYLDQDKLLQCLKPALEGDSLIGGAHTKLNVDDHNLTLLHHAVLQGNLDQVNQLLENGAQVNWQGMADGRFPNLFPLHIAAAKGFLEIATTLLKHGANVNAIGPGMYTPLHFASMHGKSVQLVALLLHSKGIELSFCKRGKHPFHLAVMANQSDVVTTFLEFDKSLVNIKTKSFRDGSGREQPEKTPFELAGEYYRRELQRELTKAAVDLGMTDFNAYLIQAAESVDLDRVKQLLGQGAQINAQDAKGKTAMHAAAGSEQHREPGTMLAILQVLLKVTGMDPNLPDVNGRTPIFAAIYGRRGNDEKKLKERMAAVQLLVQNGAHVIWQDKDGLTPAHCAADRCLDVLKYFVEELGLNLSDLHAVDNTGNTVLHVATKLRYVEEYQETIDYIVAHFPDLLNRANNQGKTALHLCVGSLFSREYNRDDETVVQMLIDQGADVFAGPPSASLIHEVVQSRIRGYIKNHVLLSILAAIAKDGRRAAEHINSKDEFGFTPLMKACALNDCSFINTLMQHGAGVDALDWLSGSLDWIKLCPNPLIVRSILQKMDADITFSDGTNNIIHASILNTNIEVPRALLSFLSTRFPVQFTEWINYKSTVGNTPLAWAAAAVNGSAEKVRLVLDYQADINQCNLKDRNTPLHLAAKYGEMEIIRVLVGAGADSTCRNYDGQIPLDMWSQYVAAKPGHVDEGQNMDIVEMLQKK